MTTWREFEERLPHHALKTRATVRASSRTGNIVLAQGDTNVLVLSREQAQDLIHALGRAFAFLAGPG